MTGHQAYIQSLIDDAIDREYPLTPYDETADIWEAACALGNVKLAKELDREERREQFQRLCAAAGFDPSK